MKHLLTVFLLYVTLSVHASGSELDYEKCAKIYVSVNNAGGKLNAQETGKFLNAISCDYFKTAEGGEFGSELIMTVLENSPYVFLSEFDMLPNSLQKVILAEIQDPIHDGFDLQNIHNNVSNLKTNSPTKKSLIAAIKQAAKAQGSEIK